MDVKQTKEPFVVAIDGVDKSGKSTFLPKIQKKLQHTLGLSDDDILIVKFEKDKLEWSMKKQLETIDAQIDNSGKWESEMYFLKMWNFLRWEIDHYRRLCPQRKIILLDRSIVSFVVNRWRAIWYDNQKMAKLWSVLEHKWLPMPHVFIHATADTETISARFKHATEQGDSFSYTDHITFQDIAGSLESYKNIIRIQGKLIDKDNMIQLDTSWMFWKNGANAENPAYEKQLTDIVSFICAKYRDWLSQKI